MVRAVVASTVGTSIEWYDYFLFGTAGALVFAKLFFPKSDPLTGTLNTFLPARSGRGCSVRSVTASGARPPSSQRCFSWVLRRS